MFGAFTAPVQKNYDHRDIYVTPNYCWDDIMRDQLEYLIEHHTKSDGASQAECVRYMKVQELLLAVFK